MIIISFNEIIAQIPNILVYFVPGFLFMCIYMFFCSKNIKEQEHFMLWCVVISFTINSLLSFNSQLTYSIKTLLGVIISVILGWLCSQATKSSVVKTVFKHLGYKSVNDDLIRDVMDFELGCTLRIYDADGCHYYVGDLYTIEEKGNDSLLSLTDYSICERNSSGEWIDITDPSKYRTSLLLKMENIKYIEIYYDPNSDILLDR